MKNISTTTQACNKHCLLCRPVSGPPSAVGEGSLPSANETQQDIIFLSINNQFLEMQTDFIVFQLFFVSHYFDSFAINVILRSFE